jgi:hypothetical protein
LAFRAGCQLTAYLPQRLAASPVLAFFLAVRAGIGLSFFYAE